VNESIEMRNEESRVISSPGYLEVIGIALVIVLGALFAYDRFLVPKVKVADLKGYLQEQKTLLAAGTITEDQWKRNLDTLEQVFREQPPHHLIILKDVVLHHDPNTEIKLK
jgi:cytochrome c-type biogenesis protein CcmE